MYCVRSLEKRREKAAPATPQAPVSNLAEEFVNVSSWSPPEWQKILEGTAFELVNPSGWSQLQNPLLCKLCCFEQVIGLNHDALLPSPLLESPGNRAARMGPPWEAGNSVFPPPHFPEWADGPWALSQDQNVCSESCYRNSAQFLGRIEAWSLHSLPSWSPSHFSLILQWDQEKKKRGAWLWGEEN